MRRDEVRPLRDSRSAETSSQRASKSMTEWCQLLLPDRLRLSRHGPVLVGVGVGEKGEGKVADPFIGSRQRSRLPDSERSHSNIMCFITGFSASETEGNTERKDERGAKFYSPEKR